MDTSKEYIDMCRKAVEIQKLWSASVGDMTDRGCVIGISTPHLLVAVRIPEKPLEQEFLLKKELVWLPRQDQLQDMTNINKLFDFYGLIKTFNRFATGETCIVGSTNQNIAYLKQFESMEQLWLAFVMHVKYGKKWNGENWE